MAISYTFSFYADYLRAVLLSAALIVTGAVGCEAGHGGSATAHYARGYELYKEGKLELAREELDLALEENPKYSQAYLTIGNIYEDQQKFDEAIASYGKIISYNPSHVMAHVNLANAQRKLGQLSQAVRSMEKAAVLEPGKGWIHDNLGNIYQQMGELAKAEAKYREAINLESHEPEFHMDLANLLVKLGNKQEAATHYRQVLKIVEGLKQYQREASFAQKKLEELAAN